MVIAQWILLNLLGASSIFVEHGKSSEQSCRWLCLTIGPREVHRPSGGLLEPASPDRGEDQGNSTEGNTWRAKASVENA